MAIEREAALEADAADPLSSFRDRFEIGDPDRIYLDGNSLGRLPLATRERLAVMAGEWGERLVSGWQEWIDEPVRVGDLLGERLLGADPGEVVVCDSTTVNLYKLCGAILSGPEPPEALITDLGEFPTDRYVLEGLSARDGVELRFFDADLEAALPQGRSLVVLSQVAYRSGALTDIRAVEELAAEHGATVIWDLSHSVGAVPITLRAAGARLAVGCSYKYLNGGPGAPGWLYVAAELQDGLRSPIQGWFGQADQFRMERRSYEPAPGVARFLAGTPPILGIAAVEEGVRLVAEAGIEALRAKSIAQTELARELFEAWLRPLGFTLETPADPALRGSHLCLGHPEAWPICRALDERANVVVDFRDPDAIRLAIAPLYTRFADVWDACDRIRRLVAADGHRGYGAERRRVT